MPDPTHHSRKLVWVFAAIGALSIFTISIVAYITSHQGGYAGPIKSNNQNQGQQNNQPAPQTVVTEVDSAKSPVLFPENLPTESGSTVVKNYNTSTADGRTIGTRVFTTTKSIDENYRTYEAYFKQQGWTVTGTPEVRGSDAKTMIATKDNMQAQVTIGNDPVANARTVAIIMTQSRASAAQ